MLHMLHSENVSFNSPSQAMMPVHASPVLMCVVLVRALLVRFRDTVWRKHASAS